MLHEIEITRIPLNLFWYLHTADFSRIMNKWAEEENGSLLRTEDKAEENIRKIKMSSASFLIAPTMAEPNKIRKICVIAIFHCTNKNVPSV